MEADCLSEAAARELCSRVGAREKHWRIAQEFARLTFESGRRAQLLASREQDRPEPDQEYELELSGPPWPCCLPFTEDLGLVDPGPRGRVHEKSFDTMIPMTTAEDIGRSADGEQLAFTDVNGWEWIVTVGPEVVMFRNDWSTGHRSFMVRRDYF